MGKLTQHFSLAEMTKTSIKGVSNTPDAKATENLKRVCLWLEELRQEWNQTYGEGDDPIVINSAYRAPAVNMAVGGVPTSNHLTGCAVDIRVSGMEQALRYAVILLDIADRQKKDFDEIILERSKSVLWLHFAVRPEGNRRKIVLLNK
jgi:uncharacterized protein YcbK (DUF882 family)